MYWSLVKLISCNFSAERLWRDVWLAVTQLYYGVLHDLEEDGLLDITGRLHLYCVHYAFLPRLKEDLARFTRSWDNHPLRTEQNMTPNQLWHLGLMQNPVREPEVSEVIVKKHDCYYIKCLYVMYANNTLSGCAYLGNSD